ncbi:hypothetical protein RDWZM_008260 [Blomia tropicalis]|uniref:Uncharacterized protein n=1 Tax=Blomia tropicalis TaxID=40697 RepID=A0A9Q0RIP9_BLOTA|nr:hypothetical protein RDWZM_008260 [Blomia tropicalis]
MMIQYLSSFTVSFRLSINIKLPAIVTIFALFTMVHLTIIDNYHQYDCNQCYRKKNENNNELRFETIFQIDDEIFIHIDGESANTLHVIELTKQQYRKARINDLFGNDFDQMFQVIDFGPQNCGQGFNRCNPILRNILIAIGMKHNRKEIKMYEKIYSLGMLDSLEPLSSEVVLDIKNQSKILNLPKMDETNFKAAYYIKSYQAIFSIYQDIAYIQLTTNPSLPKPIKVLMPNDSMVRGIFQWNNQLFGLDFCGHLISFIKIDSFLIEMIAGVKLHLSKYTLSNFFKCECNQNSTQIIGLNEMFREYSQMYRFVSEKMNNNVSQNLRHSLEMSFHKKLIEILDAPLNSTNSSVDQTMPYLIRTLINETKVHSELLVSSKCKNDKNEIPTKWHYILLGIYLLLAIPTIVVPLCCCNSDFDDDIIIFPGFGKRIVKRINRNALIQIEELTYLTRPSDHQNKQLHKTIPIQTSSEDQSKVSKSKSIKDSISRLKTIVRHGSMRSLVTNCKTNKSIRTNSKSKKNIDLSTKSSINNNIVTSVNDSDNDKSVLLLDKNSKNLNQRINLYRTSLKARSINKNN